MIKHRNTENDPVFQKRRWLFLLAGNSHKASSRVRGYWIAEEMRGCGQTCRLLVCDSPFSLVIAALLIPWSDVVVFQKTYSRHHRRLQQLCRRLGKSTVVDIDDAPSKSGNAATLENFRSMCRTASIVFAGCEELASFTRGEGARTELVPTGIQLRSYSGAEYRSGAPVRIAWVGDAGQYALDLVHVLLPALQEVARDHEIVFKIVGAMNSTDLQRAFGQQSMFQVELIDEVDWASPGAVAAQLKDVDIGVYPLLNSPFNDYKCGFKALEYMACGLPVVATPNPANLAIITQGDDGFLAKSTEEWVEALSKLIRSPELRRQLGISGREKVSQHYDTGVVARHILNIAERGFTAC